MILHCGSADDGSGGTVTVEAQVLELFSSTDPSSFILATATEIRLVASRAW